MGACSIGHGLYIPRFGKDPFCCSVLTLEHCDQPQRRQWYKGVGQTKQWRRTFSAQIWKSPKARLRITLPLRNQAKVPMRFSSISSITLNPQSSASLLSEVLLYRRLCSRTRPVCQNSTAPRYQNHRALGENTFDVE